MALAYSEWDFSAYFGVDSDYREVEVSVEGADPPTNVNAGSPEGEYPVMEVGEVGAHNARETQAAGVTGETVLIVDNESAA